MEKIKLKNSDLYVSRICFGGCPMGGHGWGDVSKNDLIIAVKEALKIGVNFFDTADIYGLGQSEKILGEALAENKYKVVIASKFGVRIKDGITYYDNSSKWIIHSLNKTLERLDRDFIDLYQLHYRDDKTPLEEVIHTLEKLKKEKKIRYYGFSNLSKKDLSILKKFRGKFVTIQEEFSLANRKNQELIENFSNKLNVNVMTWGSLGQGILTGKYDYNSKFDSSDRRSRKEYSNFHGKKLLHNLEIVEILKILAEKYNKPISAVAIRWILDFISDSIVIVGIKNKNQLDMNIKAFNWSLLPEDLNRLTLISQYEEENEK